MFSVWAKADNTCLLKYFKDAENTQKMLDNAKYFIRKINFANIKLL